MSVRERSFRGLHIRIISNSPEETASIGRRLGMCLQKGDIVCMYGDVGSGKTTMVKGMGSAFGIDDRDITSASFTIVAEYATDPPFVHIDLYRLDSEGDILELGLDDYISGEQVTVIEWAERFKEVSGRAVIVRMVTMSETSREIEIEGINEEDWDHC